jgi:hypothetical protein
VEEHFLVVGLGRREDGVEGLFGLGSLAIDELAADDVLSGQTADRLGLWVAVNIYDEWSMLIAAGALPMAGFGFILDRLPVSRRLWSAFYVAASVGWLVWMLWQFPTLERAIAKSGSILAYAFCAANLGIYSSVLLFLVGGTITWLWRRFFR